MANCAI